VSVTVEKKQVTQSVIVITLDADTAAQLEAVLSKVRFYDGSKHVDTLQGLEDLYNALDAGYYVNIASGEIVLEKY
jgi:hypothetical protein